MKQIRIGTFETNSSSTHSIAIMSEEDYDKWLIGEVLYDQYHNTIVKDIEISQEELDKEAEEYYNGVKTRLWKDWKDIDEEDKNSYRRKARKLLMGDAASGVTYDDFIDGLEVGKAKFETKYGDKVVAISAYGYR